MKSSVIGNHRAADIALGTGLAGQPIARDHLEGLAEMLFPQFVLPCHGIVLRLILRGDEASALAQLAIDLLGLHEIEHIVEGGAHVAEHGDRPLQPLMLPDAPEAVLQRAADIAGIARAGAFARVLRVEHGDAAARAGQRQRRRQAGMAGADDRHVDLRRQRTLRHLRPWCRIPPIGLFPEAGREDLGRVGHVGPPFLFFVFGVLIVRRARSRRPRIQLRRDRRRLRHLDELALFGQRFRRAARHAVGREGRNQQTAPP